MNLFADIRELVVAELQARPHRNTGPVTTIPAS